MGKSDTKFQVVYRGETFDSYRPGGWVFFQRNKEHGGGYWLGKTYDNVFIIEYERPISLFEGIIFINQSDSIAAKSSNFDDDFFLS
ncbi:hypothetical protein AUM89_15305 [Cronobacter sakazakii]|nr:hypothetical protein [Cronobacter sakazakii]EGT4327036.1 hypothetical protein [Cronobacter sakazakii]EGT4364614.1 hypothetical protein [Cronobacter sakazakii]